MRILVVTNLYPPDVRGGYEILCRQVVDILREKGHDVLVATSRPRHGTQDTGDGIRRVFRLYTPFGKKAGKQRIARALTDPLNFLAARHLISGFRPHVIHAWSLLRLGLGPIRAAQRAGVPVVFSLNDPHLALYVPARPGPSPRKLAAFAADRFLLPYTTLKGIDMGNSTCISHCLRDELVDAGVPVGDARIILQGIPVRDFPPKPRPGFIGSPLKLLYAGQLHEYKGAHTLLEAAGRLAGKMRPDGIEVTIAGLGDPGYERRLRDEAGKLPCKVVFAGRVAHRDMPALYRDHHVFVFTSLWREPFGLTHLEAMASGTVVVSTAEGGQAEVLEHGRNALVFPKGDARALAACIEELVHDPEKAARLAATARRNVESRFDVRNYAASLEHLLGQAAASGGRP